MDGGDTDRRLALIGFDNAIEVCIDTFIRLHPKLRSGFEISREDSERARRNYHTKIEFLDTYISRIPGIAPMPVTSIVWYHQLRNELYHSGNGMVPETHVVEGSRDTALRVFEALFRVDARVMLGRPSRLDTDSRSGAYVPTENLEMEFLRIFIAFEEALRNFLGAQGVGQIGAARSVAELWLSSSTYHLSGGDSDRLVRSAINARNRISHGHSLGLEPDALVAMVAGLMDLKAWLKDRT